MSLTSKAGITSYLNRITAGVPVNSSAGSNSGGAPIPSSGGGSRSSSGSTYSVSGTQEAQEIARSTGRQVEVVRIDPTTGQPAEVRVTNNPIPSSGLSGGAQLGLSMSYSAKNPDTRAALAGPANKEVSAAKSKAEAFVAGEDVTLSENELRLIRDYGYQGLSSDQYYRDLYQKVLTEERRPLIEQTQKSFAEYSLGSQEAETQAKSLLEAYKKTPSIDTSTGKPIEVKDDAAALAVLLAKEFYPAYVEKQTSMGRTYLMSETDMARILLSIGVGTDTGLEMALKGNLYSQFGDIGHSKSIQQYKDYQSEQEAAKQQIQTLNQQEEAAKQLGVTTAPAKAPVNDPLGIMTPPTAESLAAGQVAVEKMKADLAPTPEKEQAALQSQATQKVMLEAFSEAAKDAQKEALTLGAPVTLTSEKISEKAIELVSPGGKYAEGVPIIDPKAEAELTNTFYAGLKAESIIEGAKSGTGSAFALSDADVKALAKAGVEPDAAKQVQALPGQVADYNIAIGKVQQMLDITATGKAPDTKLTNADIKALESVGFLGLQDKTGLVVAKPSEINSYLDYLGGKGAPDSAYLQPSIGIGLQPKSPFVYEALGPRGEILKANFAVPEITYPDPTNPWKSVTVYKAPPYGPQPKPEDSMKLPEPSGNVIADFASGAKAPLSNLAKDIGLGGAGIGLGFQAIAEKAMGITPEESQAARRAGELGAEINYTPELEMRATGLGIKAASDLITTGKTDVSGKDLDKLMQEVMVNPAFAAGNILGSAAFWIGPQAAVKGVKVAQTGLQSASSIIKPLRAYEAERLAATTTKALGYEEFGIQALGKADTPLSVGPLGYFLRPAGPASGRILYPELQVVGDAAKLGIGKTPIKIPTSPEAVAIRSGIDEAAQEVGVILPKEKEIKMVTGPLSEEQKWTIKGFEQPKVGIGPPSPRKLNPGEIAAKNVEDIFGEGYTGAKAGEILGTNVKASTLAKDLNLMKDPLSIEADLPKLGKVGLDIVERAPEHIIRGDPLIKFKGKDPIASILTYSTEDVSKAAKVGAKRADQIKRANDALKDMAGISRSKPARPSDEGTSLLQKYLDRESPRKAEPSILPTLEGKSAESSTKALEAGVTAAVGANVSRALGFGGATGAGYSSSRNGVDFGIEFLKTPPGFDTPSMAKNVLGLDLKTGSQSLTENLLGINSKSLEVPLSTPDVKIDLGNVLGLRNVPSQGSKEDLSSMLDLGKMLENASMVDTDLSFRQAQTTGLRLDTMQKQITDLDLTFKLDIPTIKLTTKIPPRIPFDWPALKKRKKKKKGDEEEVTRWKRDYRISDILEATFGKDAPIAKAFKPFGDDWDWI